MTILLGLESDRQRRQEAAIRATPEPVLGEPGVLQGIPTGIAAGAQEADLDTKRLSTILNAGLYSLDDDSPEAEEYFDRINRDFPKQYEAVVPDPMTVGAVGQFSRELTRFLLPAVIPYIGTAIVAGNQTVNTMLDLEAQGVDLDTAIDAGVASGLTAAIGVKAPLLGRTRLGRAGLGVGVNVGLGAGQRGLTGAILEDEYPEIAAQYSAFNTRDILLDAAIGGIAGAILPGAEPGSFKLPRLRRSEADAILAENNAANLRENPRGVEPTSVKAEAYIQDNKVASIEALARGEPFTPKPRPEGVDVVRTPRTVEREDAARAAEAEFRAENGIVDQPFSPEEGNLRARVLETLETVVGGGRVVDERLVRDALTDVFGEAEGGPAQAVRAADESPTVEGEPSPTVADLDARLEALENEGIIERGVDEAGQPTIRLRELDREAGAATERTEAAVSESTVQQASDEFLEAQFQQLAETEPELVSQVRVESDAGGEVKDVTLEELSRGVDEDVSLLEQVARCYIAGI